MRCLFLAILLLLLASCGSESNESGGESTAAGKGANQASEATTDQRGEADQYFPAGDYSAWHILVTYKGAPGASPDVTRSKEEARARAESLIEELVANPDQFETIAKRDSDRLNEDGSLEVLSWEASARFKQIQDPLKTIKPGEVYPEPLEFPDGFYIFQRLEPAMVKYYTGAAFFIAFAGHPESPPNVTRTRQEAQDLAAKVGLKVSADNFLDLAKEYNDLQPGPTSLGIVQENAPVPSGFLDALERLSYNEVGGPAAMPYGFAFIKRYKVVPLRGAHILIAHKGATRAPAHVTRTEEEARELAAKLIEEAQGQSEEAFAALAQANSDGPSAPKGGNLGSWYRGQMVLEFDQAILQIEPGQITPEPVKTTFGYHVIMRLP